MCLVSYSGDTAGSSYTEPNKYRHFDDFFTTRGAVSDDNNRNDIFI